MSSTKTYHRAVGFFVISYGLSCLAARIWPEALFWLASGISPQRPTHNWTIHGTPLPLEARLSGVYMGIALTLLLLAYSGKVRHQGFAQPQVLFILLLGLIPMVIDGSNAVLYDLGLHWFYPPSADVRLITGTLFGASAAHLLLPVLNLNLNAPTSAGNPINSPKLTETGDLIGIFLQVPIVWATGHISNTLVWSLLAGLSMCGLVWFVSGGWLLLLALWQRPRRGRSTLALMLAILSLALWGGVHHLVGIKF